MAIIVIHELRDDATRSESCPIYLSVALASLRIDRSGVAYASPSFPKVVSLVMARACVQNENLHGGRTNSRDPNRAVLNYRFFDF